MGEWATLIRDMLHEIRRRSSLVTRARMRVVCSDWRAADAAFVSAPWTEAVPPLGKRARKQWVAFCVAMTRLHWPVIAPPLCILENQDRSLRIHWPSAYYDYDLGAFTGGAAFNVLEITYGEKPWPTRPCFHLRSTLNVIRKRYRSFSLRDVLAQLDGQCTWTIVN